MPRNTLEEMEQLAREVEELIADGERESAEERIYAMVELVAKYRRELDKEPSQEAIGAARELVDTISNTLLSYRRARADEEHRRTTIQEAQELLESLDERRRDFALRVATG